MAARKLRSVILLLTSDCNLRCAYCYENSKRKGRIRWDTLRAAIEQTLSHGRSGVTISFSGGEPLLEFPLIERAVRHVRQNAPSGKRVRFVLVTNGTMLDEEKISFLCEHGFDVQLSFDGVRTAQDFRGKSTFDYLDRLLEDLSERHSRFYRSRLTVNTTATPQAVGHLADSVDYFLRRRVERVEISPSIGDCSDWQLTGVEWLESQFARIVNSSLVHFRKTGKIPLTLFRDRDARGRFAAPGTAWIPGTSRRMCGIMDGEKLAVDVDGELSACATLVRSCQRFPSKLLRRTAETMRIGNVRSKTFLENHGRFLNGALQADIFYRKEDKYSSYGRCRDCRYFAVCGVCPVSIGHIPGNEDPNRIPDFGCAFTLAAGKYRERFWRRVSSEEKTQ